MCYEFASSDRAGTRPSLWIGRDVAESVVSDRYEYKYAIPASMADQIRSFIRPLL